MKEQEPRDSDSSRIEKNQSEQLIEKLPISEQQKIDIALLEMGFKDLVDIPLGYDLDEVKAPERQRQICVLLEGVSSLGLVHSPVENEDLDLFVAKSKDKLAKAYAFRVLGEKDSADRDRLYGELFGFPETAIRNYTEAMALLRKPDQSADEIVEILKDRFIEVGELPAEIKEQDFLKFLSFRLSRKNWEQELGIVQEWAAALRNFYPALYREVLESKKVK